MSQIPISICLFTTTKGHYKFNTHNHTLNRLNELIPLDDIGKFAHVKVSSGHNNKLEKISHDLSKFGFKTLYTEQDWNREDNNHASAYYQDMLTLLNHNDVHKNPYILFLEDDWLINCEGDLLFYFKEAIKYLKEDKDLLAIRINHEINKDTSKAFRVNNNFYLQNKDYTQYGPTLTFQPTIMRTRDWYTSVRLINKNWEQFKNQHCELVSGNVIRYLFSDSARPFAFFNPEKLNCTHIGCKEFIEKHLNEYN